jgi:hypothetical protein
MSATISTFLSSFGSELARPSRFDVTITIPLSLANTVAVSTEKLSFRCESAQLPSRSLATIEQKFGSNPVELYPYQTNYGSSQLTFLVSGDMAEKKFFDSWMDLVMPTNNYNFNYKYDGSNQNYVTTIKINQYDATGKSVYGILLNDAYPIDIGQLDLDWSSDGYHKLTVVFAYNYWSIEKNNGRIEVILSNGETSTAPGALNN